mgnify:CR=1 FL=1
MKPLVATAPDEASLALVTETVRARVVHRAVHRFTGGRRGHWERNPLNIANQENYR